MDQRLSNGGRWQLINPSLVRATVVQIKENEKEEEHDGEGATVVQCADQGGEGAKEEGVESNCPHIKEKEGELRMGRCRNGGINTEKVKPKAPLLKFWRLGKREDRS